MQMPMLRILPMHTLPRKRRILRLMLMLKTSQLILSLQPRRIAGPEQARGEFREVGDETLTFSFASTSTTFAFKPWLGPLVHPIIWEVIFNHSLARCNRFFWLQQRFLRLVGIVLTSLQLQPVLSPAAHLDSWSTTLVMLGSDWHLKDAALLEEPSS